MGSEQHDSGLTRFEKIVQDGPMTPEQLGGTSSISSRLRKEGIQTFKLRGTKSNSGQKGGGQKDVVFFHRDFHTPSEVLGKWIECNPKTITEENNWAIYQRIVSNYGEEWRVAAKEHLGPFEHLKKSSSSIERGGECPMCGTAYTRQLRDHLPCNG